MKLARNLPACWVCYVRFNDQFPNPGPGVREEHHIIPQAYGGADGPVVSLCDSHHSILHRVAEAITKNRPYQHLLGTHDQEQIKKLMFLATRVAAAELRTRNDPNKKAVIALTLDAQMKSQIDDLKKIYSNQTRSRAGILKIALHSLWSRHFS